MQYSSRQTDVDALKRLLLMEITITIDDALYQLALEAADLAIDDGNLIQEAIETFIRVQAAKRLVRLGSSLSELEDVSRRRSSASKEPG